MSLFTELKRRNVIRSAIAYVVVSWVLAQVAEFAFETFAAPDWVLKSVVVILLLGLPLVLVFAWAYELTPEGIKRESEVDRSQSITRQTGHKLDRVVIAVLLIAVAWFAWDKFARTPVTATTPAATANTPDASFNAPDKSVAVLPFVAMTGGTDDEFFADGLTEEILNSLAQLPELRVTARTSAFSFKGRNLPVRDIAMALGVSHVVEGSVRRSGDRLRVTAQLVRADQGFHLWSENYDSTSADTIDVQENIAEKIAVALDIVLDEGKRDSMRRAGLRDIEAFTMYQKGIDLYDRAHGDADRLGMLRQANRYFEQVIDRVPEYWTAYANHSDLYIHLLNDSVAGSPAEGVTEEVLADAYATALADYEAATRYAPSPRLRHIAELDYAFLSGNWRGLPARMERALAKPGCSDGNWVPTVANVLGYAAEYHELAAAVLACDPLRSLSWFNAARSKLWAGDAGEALRLAREGADLAPGPWLNMTLIQALMANGLHDEAEHEIDARIEDADLADVFRIMVAAHRGDPDRLEPLLEAFDNRQVDNFFTMLVDAWTGRNESVNRRAAAIDKHFFGAMVLWQTANWCQCGAPWDLAATPNFAAKIEEAGLNWPPQATLRYPLTIR